MLARSDISIVIVNWNSGPLLGRCLGSVPLARLPDGWQLAGVVVVDNGSTDGSLDGIDPPPASYVVIRNAENRGFAAACNQGAAAIASDLVLFLNPDTQLEESSLCAPIQHMHAPAHARTGIVGIGLFGEAGTVTRCCARFPRAWHFLFQALGVDRVFPSSSHLMREWTHDETRRVDQVIGAFFLVRRRLFDELRGFDERFFVYFEEVDFSLRASRIGWSTVFVAGAKAFHLGGGSSQQIKGRRLFYSLRSRLQYGAKHFSAFEVALLLLVSLLLEPLARLVHLTLTGRFREVRHLAEGYALLLWQGSSTLGRPPTSA